MTIGDIKSIITEGKFHNIMTYKKGEKLIRDNTSRIWKVSRNEGAWLKSAKYYC